MSDSVLTEFFLSSRGRDLNLEFVIASWCHFVITKRERERERDAHTV